MSNNIINYYLPKSNTLLIVSKCKKFLGTKANHCLYPIVKGIPRFVKNKNYAEAFGFQWNKFYATQLDSKSGTTNSEDRLSRVLGFPLKQLSKMRVLEAGSGAGRFTEILLKYGALLDSFDFSNACEANKKIIQMLILLKRILIICHTKITIMILYYASVFCSTHRHQRNQ